MQMESRIFVWLLLRKAKLQVTALLDEQVCCSGGGCWLANCPGDRLSRKLPPIYH